MRFLTLYTAANPDKGPPSREDMAKMGAFVEASTRSGTLIATGSVIPSATNGMRMSLADGRFDVATAPSRSEQKQTGGWAILNVNSPEHLQEVTRQFLEVVGDGTVEVLEIFQVPMP